MMMSLSKDKKPIPASQAVQIVSQQKKGSSLLNSLTATNQIQEYFSFKIQNIVDDGDDKVAWAYNVPVLKTNERQIYLLTQKLQTTIIDFVGDQFPQTIYLSLRNFGGLINQKGIVTNKIIALNLNSVAIKNQSGLVTRDLLYSSDIVNNWPLGSLRQLRMEIYLDEETTPLSLPLSNPLNVSFKILHVCY